MKIALVHDWLNGMRGGEKVLELLCDIFPGAPIHTLLFEPDKIDPGMVQGRAVRTSWIQKNDFVRRNYRALLPFMPATIAQFDLTPYDLVISSSHCVAKGVRVSPHACHICYCHTPMRYIWDFQQEYFGPSTAAKRLFLEPVLNALRRWDVRTAAGVHHFIANSRFVADRIQRVYAREAQVIHPPVDTDYFQPSFRRGNYYLMVSALVPYKKVDLAIEAFRQNKEPLLIIGTGPQEAAMRRRAPDNVIFLGWEGADTLKYYYAGCRALIFPQKEDFGIVPLEVQAAGRPVIAFGEGGALETIVGHPDGYLPQGALLRAGEPTGIFFKEQTVESLLDAVKIFEKTEKSFHSPNIRQNAMGFDKKICREKLKDFILSKAPGAAEKMVQYA